MGRREIMKIKGPVTRESVRGWVKAAVMERWMMARMCNGWGNEGGKGSGREGGSEDGWCLHMRITNNVQI